MRILHHLRGLLLARRRRKHLGKRILPRQDLDGRRGKDEREDDEDGERD